MTQRLTGFLAAMVLAAGIAWTAAPARAHHSGAMFDRTQTSNGRA